MIRKIHTMSEKEKNRVIGFIENFWYHNKWKTLLTLFFAVVIIVCTTQCATRQRPDQTVFMYLSRNVSANQTAALSEAILGYFDDYNSDGEASILIDNASVDPTAVGTDAGMSASTKVLGEIGACNSIIYIVDDKKFDYYMQDNLSLFENLGLPDKDGYAWNWKGSELQLSLKDTGLPEDMYFCVRRVEGTISGSDKKYKLAQNAKSALYRIMETGGIAVGEK